jgi:hypothetical protein
MSKVLQQASDGRIIVKKIEKTVPKITYRLPKEFMVVEAYGERCLSGFEPEEMSRNAHIMAWYAGADNSERKKYDPAVVCMQIPVGFQ